MAYFLSMLLVYQSSLWQIHKGACTKRQQQSAGKCESHTGWVHLGTLQTQWHSQKHVGGLSDEHNPFKAIWNSYLHLSQYPPSPQLQSSHLSTAGAGGGKWVYSAVSSLARITVLLFTTLLFAWGRCHLCHINQPLQHLLGSCQESFPYCLCCNQTHICCNQTHTFSFPLFFLPWCVGFSLWEGWTSAISLSWLNASPIQHSPDSCPRRARGIQAMCLALLVLQPIWRFVYLLLPTLMGKIPLGSLGARSKVRKSSPRCSWLCMDVYLFIKKGDKKEKCLMLSCCWCHHEWEHFKSLGHVSIIHMFQVTDTKSMP